MPPPGMSSSRCRMGTPKASVLPVPVLACPMRSWPLSATGRVSAWIGKAVVMPSASSAAQMGSAMPELAERLDLAVRFQFGRPEGGRLGTGDDRIDSRRLVTSRLTRLAVGNLVVPPASLGLHG